MSVHLVPIFTQTVGSSGANSVVFNNIPQGYTDLKLVISARTNASALMSVGGLQFGTNGVFDVGTNYSRTYGQAYGSGYYSGRNQSSSNIEIDQFPAASATASTFGNVEVYIPNYASGNYKQVIYDDVAENNSSTDSNVVIVGGLWRSTNPITNLQIFAYSANFVQYSTFTLYGVSNQFATQTPIAPTITSVVDQAGFASVNFLPTASDNATLYAVTDNNNNTTYGAGSPIVAPATLGSQTTYTAKAINNVATTSASGTASITSNNSFASIATQVVGSGGSQITFNNIPQNYTHLQLRIFGRLAAAVSSTNSFVQLNNDGSTTYWFHLLSGDGSTASSSNGNSSIIAMPPLPGTSAAANIGGIAIIDILDYTNTNKYKTLRGFGGSDLNGSGTVGLYSGYWPQLQPITNIITGGAFTTPYTFAAGTIVALYGVA